MSQALYLESVGLTNKGSEHFGAIALGSKKTLVAICTSTKCTRYEFKVNKKINSKTKAEEIYTEYKFKDYIKKDIPRRLDHCPDCTQPVRWIWESNKKQESE